MNRIKFHGYDDFLGCSRSNSKSLKKFESFYSSIGLFFPATYLIRVSKLCICMLKNSKSLIQYLGHINQIGLKGNRLNDLKNLKL